MAEYKVEFIAVFESGKVYHNTISVKCADRNKAIGKARRMVELWKGYPMESFGFFADDDENRESHLNTARSMLERNRALIEAHAAGY
jgi:hypothetical protein